MGRLPSQRALAATLDRCENAGHGGHAPIDEVKELLKLCRDGKVRLPEQIARHGVRLVKSKEAKRKINDTELWLINEQVCYALLDTGEIDEATTIVKALAKRFPKSSRVLVLQGALCECCGDYDKAEEVYKKVLEENEAHQGAWKRLCCVAKGRGNEEKAVKTLKEYLDVFCTDAEAWEELASLYLSLSMQKQASFCYEECVLIQPQNPSYHLKYADSLYSLSTPSTLHLARQAVGYYSVVLDLTNGSSVHAKYGLLCCLDAIRSQGRGSSSRLTEDEQKLAAKCARELEADYQEKCPALLAHLRATGILSSGT